MSGQTAAIGSVLVIGLGLAVVVYAATTLRQSRALAHDAIGSDLTQPMELLCAMRMGLMSASWPGGRCLLSREGVAFDCSGRTVQALWTDVKSVELVKPLLPPIGWGVRFKLSQTSTPTVIVLAIRRARAERLVDVCHVYGAPTDQKPHLIIL